MYLLKFRIKIRTVDNITGDVESKIRGKEKKITGTTFPEVLYDPWRGLCYDLRIFQHPLHPLAKTHWAHVETKPVREVHSCLYRNISERKQVEVFELKHRLTSSKNVLLCRLKHTYTQKPANIRIYRHS